ncbi:MAG TPA: hypothetical protein DD379_20860 [Cyanobacteria bacterium UBA11162]|nr:hypothetical protein [Cyanobacteria bacterium UBA11162]
MDKLKPRKVNSSLDKHPKIAFFPADQFLPWIIILGVSYYVFKVLLQWSWIWTGGVAGWGISTWWILTGENSWRFLSKFVPVPNWVRACIRYQEIITKQELRICRSLEVQKERKKL